jgi:hypothetical protein
MTVRHSQQTNWRTLAQTPFPRFCASQLPPYKMTGALAHWRSARLARAATGSVPAARQSRLRAGGAPQRLAQAVPDKRRDDLIAGTHALTLNAARARIRLACPALTRSESPMRSRVPGLPDTGSLDRASMALLLDRQGDYRTCVGHNVANARYCRRFAATFPPCRGGRRGFMRTDCHKLMPQLLRAAGAGCDRPHGSARACEKTPTQPPGQRNFRACRGRDVSLLVRAVFPKLSSHVVTQEMT